MKTLIDTPVLIWFLTDPARLYTDAVRAGRLERDHRDPWDRILAAQALEDAIPIISADRRLRLFGVRLIW